MYAPPNNLNNYKYKSGNIKKSVNYDSKPAGRKNPELKRQPVWLWRHAMSKAKLGKKCITSNEGESTLINVMIICVYWFKLFSQVSDVAHVPLVTITDENNKHVYFKSCQLMFRGIFLVYQIFPWNFSRETNKHDCFWKGEG